MGCVGIIGTLTSACSGDASWLFASTAAVVPKLTRADVIGILPMLLATRTASRRWGPIAVARHSVQQLDKEILSVRGEWMMMSGHSGRSKVRCVELYSNNKTLRSGLPMRAT